MNPTISYAVNHTLPQNPHYRVQIKQSFFAVLVITALISLFTLVIITVELTWIKLELRKNK